MEKNPETRRVLNSPPVKTLVLSGILVALVVITHSVIVPFEHTVLGDPFDQGVLFYLPFGFWVIVAYFERWHAALYLAPGFALGMVLYAGSGAPITARVLTLGVLTLTAPAVFAILAWASGRANHPVSEPSAWRLIVTAGLFTAMVNAIGLNLVRNSVVPDSASLTGVIQYFAGSIVGMFTCLIGLAIAFRIRKSVLNLR
ncbi:hypothetical protein C7455_1037 [Roseicyclus mahoneyensis]|jgi:hypothetical protein|uniref:MASE1 protein n=1 Tax=Roseicyclus mahoneyensis TaxID=164332 RepID=A0A316H080_9RHOB|nr:hypothetical protein C7455_1037 [Roseicyclus mahoneyensis]